VNVAVPVLLTPYTQKPGITTFCDPTVVILIDGAPAAVQVTPLGDGASKNLLVSLLVIVTACPEEALPPCRLQLAVAWRFRPTDTALHEMPAWFTIARTVLPDAGVLKPAGATAVRVVLPELFLSGVNGVVPVLSPPAKTTGEAADPTDGVELVTATEAVNAPLVESPGFTNTVRTG